MNSENLEIKNMNNKPRVFCSGDIHGAYLALIQVLERCEFDYENDWLITIGDIVDGWGDSYLCVEELLKIKNRIDIMGNHDNWFRVFIESGIHEMKWGMGGLSTAKSYAKAIGMELKIQDISVHGEEAYMLNLNNGDVPESHKIFFKSQNHYYKDPSNNLFIHGGFNRMAPLNQTLPYTMMWDRHLWRAAMSVRGSKMKLKYEEEFNQIFIGHTATTFWNTDEPIKADKIWNIDTGGGSDGKLTLMNIETNEYFQSDLVRDLYPDDEHILKIKQLTRK